MLQRLRNNSYFCFFFALFFTFSVTYQAIAESILTIRDSETEQYLHEITDPLLQNAGIDPTSVQIHILQDSSINAFVSEGLQIFINTGLIEESDDPDMLRGVLAHEIGHIQGAHLIKGGIKSAAEMTQYIALNLAIIGTALLSGGLSGQNTSGLGWYSASSGGDALMAAVLANNQIAERRILAFTRMQESEADRYAMLAMQKTHMDPSGMVRLFAKLQKLQDKFSGKIDKYSVTHPLTQERIEYFKSAPVFQHKVISKSIMKQHEMVRAKICGYSTKDGVKCDMSSASQEALMYYEAFRFINQKNYKMAKSRIIVLLAKDPYNPYFHELLAQVESYLGNMTEMKKEYKVAISTVDIKYVSPMETEYAYTILAKNPSKSDVKSVMIILNRLRLEETYNMHTYDGLSKGYKILGDADMSEVIVLEGKIVTQNSTPQENAAFTKDLDKILKKSNNRPDVISRIQYLKSLTK